MECFYQGYHKKTSISIKKRFENYKSSLEINWAKEFREAESIVFNNKNYKFGLFYEKKDIEGHLHFWRLNEENKWERLSFINSSYVLANITNPYIDNINYFYVWVANNAGNDYDGTIIEQYYFI